MNVLITLENESKTLTVEPASCIINRGICNDSLQHREDSCDIKLIYDSELFAFFVENKEISAVVKTHSGEVLFTGTASADVNWSDEGAPYPIRQLPLTIKDYTSKLDRTSASEIAYLDTSLTKILAKLAIDCGLSISSDFIPAVNLKAFVMPAGRNYLQVFDILCYQYGLTFYFDQLGRICFFNFNNIPNILEIINDSIILSGMKTKKSAKRYDAVKISYNTLTEKTNEQIFFESFGYDSDNNPTPVIIQPGVYYPFDSSPLIEETEGQVYQSFASGFAESRKKYNGELEYRRSKDTKLLYTYNHKVVEDWEGQLDIERTEFETLRASVRFKNNSDVDVKLRQFAIRADAIFRNKEGLVTAGAISDKTFSTEAEYIYTPLDAENLAKTLFRYFSRSTFSISFSTDNVFINPGTFKTIDSGTSGFTVDALVLSYTLDCDKDIYNYDVVSIGPAAVDIYRRKNAEGNDRNAIEGQDGQFTDYRFAVNDSLANPPAFDPASDDPGSNWHDIPSITAAGEYLWQLISTWRSGERLTPWEAMRISGPTGQNAVYLDLDNENHSIACFADGTPKPGSLGFKVNGTVYDGMSAVPGTDVTWDIITDATGVSINNVGTITVSQNAVLGDTTKIAVVALYKRESYFATLTLVKNKDGSSGADGQNAVDYWLQPSVSVVRRNNQSVLEPPTVSCLQYRNEAGQLTPSTELLKYRLSNMTGEANYADVPVGNIVIGSALWVEFTLYSGSGMIHDRERVPVVMDGYDGNYFEPRYMRAAVKPATPTGNVPAGWALNPPDGTDPLWMIRGEKNASGNLIGVWSTPVQISGENAWANSVPRDAFAYWSCDDVPEIPDGEAVFRQEHFASLPDGFGIWFASGGQVLYDGNIVINATTGVGGLTSKVIQTGQILIIKFSVTGSASIGFEQSPKSYANGSFLHIAKNNTTGNYNIRIYANPNSTVRVSAIYIGNAQYVTPLLDNSGNSKHGALNNSVIPTQGKFGKGLLFLSGKGIYINDNLINPNSNFTFAAWITVDVITATTKSIIANNSFNIGVYNNNIRIEASSGSWYSTGILSSRFSHIIVKRLNNNFIIKANNTVDTIINVSSFNFDPQSPTWIGSYNGIGAFFSGTLDEIAIFTRATTDAEDTAMYNSTLPKFYTHADWLLDPANPTNASQQAPMYRGATINADTTNTGIVSTTQGGNLRMNHLDYVLFNAATSFWTENYIYEWNALKREWSRLERPNNWEKYLEAVSDMTANAPEGVFSNAFIKNLVAENAFLTNLFAKTITLKRDTTVNPNVIGKIKSEGLGTDGKPLFEIDADGKAKFMDASIKGYIEATDGIFNGTFLAGDAWNKDGSVNNVNSYGGLLFKKTQSNSSESPKIKNLSAYGNAALGQPITNELTNLNIFGEINLGGTSGTDVAFVRVYNRHMFNFNGNIASFYNSINSSFSKTSVRATSPYAIRGNILITSISSGNPTYALILYVMERYEIGQYVFRGITTNNVMVAALLTSSTFVVNNLATGSSIIASASIQSIQANMLFV